LKGEIDGSFTALPSATLPSSLAEQMYCELGVVPIRRIQGLLGQARKHGAALTDDGCATALK